MLQLQYIKEHTEEIIERLKIKNVENVEERIAEIIRLDADRRALQQKADAVKAEQNAIAKEIGMLFKQGKRDEAEAKKARTADLKAQEKELDDQQAAVDADLNAKLISLPNAPHITVPRGKSEADNVVVAEFGTKPILPEGAAVSTSRNDVDYIVTEYGIARLKGRTLQHRAEDLIRIAHPDFRPQLIEDYERRFHCSYPE